MPRQYVPMKNQLRSVGVYLYEDDIALLHKLTIKTGSTSKSAAVRLALRVLLRELERGEKYDTSRN